MSLQTHRILWFRGVRLDRRYSTECSGLPKGHHLKPNLKPEPEKGRKLDPSASLNAGFIRFIVPVSPGRLIACRPG
jgi:hypothetical protein